METDLIIHGKARDLGGFSVYRILPDIQKRSVGPFVFIDHLGPMKIDATHALDVRPHPHIGLSTVTYLFEGKGFHRDSLGNKQIIEPGDLNWMTAGSGIVHSERSPQEERKPNEHHAIHGIQIWVALPKEQEDCPPSFTHYNKNLFPEIELSKGLNGKLLIGHYGDKASPVLTPSPTFFMVAQTNESSAANINIPTIELGIFVISGTANINSHKLLPQDLLVTNNSASLSLQVEAGTVLAFFGGDPLPEKRYMWWNFVSSNSEKIRAAALRWKNQEMGKVPEETEYIPLPNDPLPQ